MVLTLLIVCTVAGLALAGVQAKTGPIIATQEAQALQDGLARVMPGAAKFEALAFQSSPVVKGAWQAVDSGGKPAGWVVEAIPTGYGGGIRMLVGVTPELAVTKVDILAASNETPGLGSKATEPKFVQQFAGLKPGIAAVKNKAPQGNEIQAVTGATITSKAVLEGVNQALAAAQQLSGKR